MFIAIVDAATRKQAYEQAITDKSIDFNLLSILIDLHVTAGTMNEADADTLLGLMNPAPVEPE